MGFVEFVQDRWPVLSFLAYQHMSLVVQTLVLATVIALVDRSADLSLTGRRGGRETASPRSA